MTENDSFGGRPLVIERKIVSRPGAIIQVEQLTMSKAWHDGMARAIERGREDARKKMLSYRIRNFFSRLFSKLPHASTGG